MRSRMLSGAVALGLSAVSAQVVAASSLVGVMEGWKVDAWSMREMLAGHTAFDRTTIARVLQTFVAEAGMINARIGARNAGAPDLKARFAAFQTDARAALDDIQRRPALIADVSHLMADCRSCHDQYN